MDTSLASCYLPLSGTWTVARAAELKTLLVEQPSTAITVGLAEVERIDLAILQCLIAARRAGLVATVDDPHGVYRAECERHGFDFASE